MLRKTEKDKTTCQNFNEPIFSHRNSIVQSTLIALSNVARHKSLSVSHSFDLGQLPSIGKIKQIYSLPSSLFLRKAKLLNLTYSLIFKLFLYWVFG